MKYNIYIYILLYIIVIYIYNISCYSQPEIYSIAKTPPFNYATVEIHHRMDTVPDPTKPEILFFDDFEPEPPMESNLLLNPNRQICSLDWRHKKLGETRLVHMYMYIHVYTYIYTYVHINKFYIYILYIHTIVQMILCIYIYNIYLFTYTCRYTHHILHIYIYIY